MANGRQSNKGRRSSHTFSMWLHVCAESPNYYRLSYTAKALLFELLYQYRGKNNGDLCAAWGLLKDRGWQSPDTINRARKELLETGWIVQTRQGGLNKASLYALTIWPINECKGKGLERPETKTALAYWKQGRNPEHDQAETTAKQAA